MKKLALAIVIAVFAAPAALGATVVGSKHDLTTATGGVATGPFTTTGQTTQVCVFCHTPHSANTTRGPLWNRTASGASYTMYTSSTIDMTINPAGPQGNSAACLSCHDGTVTFDTLINEPGSGLDSIPAWTWTNTGLMTGTTGPANMGFDLRSEHPISITYDITVATGDPAFQTIATATTAGARFFGASTDQVECGSCHNPHDNSLGTFARVTNAGSALCRACHIK